MQLEPDSEALLVHLASAISEAGGAVSQAGQRLGEDLLARWGEPHRAYHDRQHLAEVLARLEELSAYLRRAAVVRLAAWFHDVIYNPRRADNEQRSAAYAGDVLTGAGLPLPVVAEVARLVLVTRRHDPAPEDVDGMVLVDADLAILAARERRYADYAAGVRREYEHVPEAAFREGRSRVLRDLLERPSIFCTAHGRERWEAAARANMHAELAHLARTDD